MFGIIALSLGRSTNPIIMILAQIANLFNLLFGQIDRVLVNFIPQYNIVKLGFRILILLYIIAFVREKFGGGTLGTVAALVAAYVFIFELPFLQFAVLAYILLTMGVSGILMDLSLANPFKWIGKKGSEQKKEGGEKF